jgi:large subunit ribosomal protein L22
MADYRYSYNGPEEGTAKALLKDAAVSTKVSIEICNYLRGRTPKKAKTILELVLKKKHAIPFTRFTDGVGHKPGPLAAGRYPQKGAQAFLDLINLAEANASHKGLSDDLIIIHLSAQKASTPFRYGRQRRRQTKRTHIELVVKEVEGAKKKTKKTTAEQSQNAEQPTERRAQLTDRTQRSEPQPRTPSESRVQTPEQQTRHVPNTDTSSAEPTKKTITKKTTAKQESSKPKQDKEATPQ